MKKKSGFNLKHWVQSPKWFLTFVSVLVLCLAAYILNAVLGEVRPSSMWGMVYGAAAAVLMVTVLFYGIRRRATNFIKHVGGGKSRNWAQFHIYGGSLFLLFMFMHSGFQIPNDSLTWWLWFFSIWVCLSGMLGIFIQKWIPRLLTSGLSIEVHYDRIPALIQEIKKKAEELMKICDEPIRDFYQKNLAMSLAAPELRLIYFIDITGGIQSQTNQFAYLRKFLPALERNNLDKLEKIYKTKLEIDAHYTLQKSLRWWLYLHVPVTLVLVVLAGLHLFSVLYY